MKQLHCFDMCCGAGALSEGFERAGAVVLGGIDVNRDALATAAANHPKGVWEQHSIESFAAKITREKDHVVWRANTLLAGLPCQGFSAAGKRDPDDPRNDLYKHFVEITAILRPEFIVIENVLGLAMSHNRAAYEAMQGTLRKLGYDVAVRVLDAVDCGVPQCRKRVFIVGVSTGKAEWVFESIGVTPRRITVREAFKGLPRSSEVLRCSHTFMDHGPKVTAMLRRLKPGGPISYRRLVWDKPSATLIAGHRALPVHPSEPRAISPREAARLQGFSDAYKFCGSRSAQIEQIANAVPPPLATAVAKALHSLSGHVGRIRGPLYRKLTRKLPPALSRRFTTAFRSVYNKNGRWFPWRAVKDPHLILLTELLLQRTNADLANTVWRQVVRLAPTATAAARARLRSLTALTQRIGIRSRARTIIRLGKSLVERHRGQVPRHFDELMRLAGVGQIGAVARNWKVRFELPSVWRETSRTRRRPERQATESKLQSSPTVQ